MSHIKAFIGPAGAGKTYALLGEIERICSTEHFEPAQSILAITLMHGSRRRLNARLKSCARNKVPIQCETIDSFCLRILNRFRQYLGKRKPIGIGDTLGKQGWLEVDREWKASFLAVRQATIELLAFPTVRSSIGFAYPVVVVDEFQDCERELLTIIGLLSIGSAVLVAADNFQHLSSTDVCPAYEWLKEVGAEVVELSGNRRTSESVLLDTAGALREGLRATSCIEVHALDGHGLVRHFGFTWT